MGTGRGRQLRLLPPWALVARGAPSAPLPGSERDSAAGVVPVARKRTKRIHERDIINEGAVWDETSGRLIELGEPWRPKETA